MTDATLTDADLSGPIIDRRTAIRLLGAGTIASLAGCTSGTEDEPAGEGSPSSDTTPGSSKSGGRLVAGWNLGEISNMDPVLNSVGGNEQASRNVFNSLLRTTPDFRIEGDAASDWTVESARKYVFNLREGMQFHGDYGEVTAEDVKFSIERGLTASGSTVESQLSRLKPIDEDGVVVEDDYTVVFNLEEPFVPFLKAVTRAGGACEIQSRQAVEELGEQYQVSPIGSGPFEVAEHDVGSSLVLRAFDDYWETDESGNQLPYLDEVEIEPIPSPSTLVNAIRSGDIQFINKIPYQNVGQVRSASGATVLDAPPGGWEGIYFNLAKEPWKDNLQLRRGVAKVLDRERYIQDAFQGNQTVAVGPTGPIHGRYYRSKDEKPDGQKFDRETGEQLIEESGAMGTDVKIMVWEAGVRRGRALSQQLSDYFNVTVNAYDISTYLDRLWPRTGSEYYDITPWGSSPHVAIDTELYNFFKSADSGGVFNRTGYSNPEVDEWLEAQRAATDNDERTNLIKNVQDQVIHDVPVAFTHHYVLWQAASNAVEGVTAHPVNRDFTRVWLPE